MKALSLIYIFAMASGGYPEPVFEVPEKVLPDYNTVELTDTLSSLTFIALKENVSLREVTSPVSVIQPEVLEAEEIYRPKSLSSLVPGLLIPDYGASLTSTIYMRGLGSRMENPVLGLYIDGIPVLDKNAYDFDWEGVQRATLLRGPQGTLYGRNAMGGVLSLRTLSPFDLVATRASVEYGSANTVRVGGYGIVGSHAISGTFRHSDGFFINECTQKLCDPYNGLSLRWKWEKSSGQYFISNVVNAGLSSEGGFAYSPAGQPVSYNDEAGYKRLSVLEGFRLRYFNDLFIAEGTASIQILADDMRMDQDYTPRSVFTLQQKQLSGAGTMEVTFRRADTKAAWQPVTGLFAFYKLNSMHAPVTFKRDGIETLILANANKNIPEDIGYLDIPDASFPVNSDFLIGSGNVALYHESTYRLGSWLLTAGLRLDYEGARMDYNCVSSLHYQFFPYMLQAKAYTLPYKGTQKHSKFVVQPKVSALFEATRDLSLYGTIAKGYRAGGFNTQIFSDILQNLMMTGLMADLGVYLDKPLVSVSADATEYAPEEAWNFEAGARYRHGSLNMEGSVYYIDVHNQQLTVFPPGKNTGRMMANAARSRSLGAEASLSWHPGNFISNLSWSFCDSRFVNYNDGQANYSGNRVPYVPQHTLYAGAGYVFDFGRWAITANASLNGVGPIFWNESNSVSEPFHLFLSGRLSVSFPHWELYLRGENLTNTRSHTFYFKSMGNDFYAHSKPLALYGGINVSF